VILVDTSAWTEYLRGTGSGTHFRLRELLAADAVLGTTDVVHMELLAGSRTETDDLQLRRMLAAMEHVPTDAVDWETAARLHRTCRRQGEPVRSLTDCLLAAVAIRVGAPVPARPAHRPRARLSHAPRRRAARRSRGLGRRQADDRSPNLKIGGRGEARRAGRAARRAAARC
jgi:predicted nucleic acid-binding protein